MKTAQELREKAEQCLRLGRATTDDKVAAALLAYGCELEARARQIEEPRTRPAQPNGRPIN